MQAVENLKAEGRYFHAGALAYSLGFDSSYYGCHYGLRSELEYAKRQYAIGYEEAKLAYERLVLECGSER